MKNFVFVLIGTVAFLSCSRNEKQDIADKAQDTQELVESKTDSVVDGIKTEANAVSENVFLEKQALISKIDESKVEVSRKLKEADKEVKSATAQEKARIAIKKEELQHSLDELDKALVDLKSEKNRDWKEFKKGLNRQIDKIQENIK